MRLGHHLQFSAALTLLCACAGKSIPPGTPPPEYERPTVTPWPPASASAEPAAEAAAPEAVPEQLDAGTADAADVDAAAPPTEQPL
jgi:hypothetical protein